MPKDASVTRHPAVVLFTGSEGGDSLAPLAESMAQSGFVAASVAYFGVPGTPASLVSVPVEIGGQAVELLSQRDDVDPSRLGVFGRSIGGEYALLVASTYPFVTRDVALVPTPFGWFGFDPDGFPTGCSWSKNQQPLSRVPQEPGAGAAVGERIARGETVAFREGYEASRQALPDLTRVFFPLEKIRGPPSLPGCDGVVRGGWARFHTGVSGDCLCGQFRESGTFNILMGGTPEADPAAANQAWPRILEFFARAPEKRE